jgi:chromosome segregation ATPase
MLDEYASKNSKLEQEIHALQQNVKQRDADVDSIRIELQEAKLQQEESRQECDSMRDELTALSQAYTSLETQYRQEQGRHGVEQNGRGGMCPSTEESSATEVVMLRVDNDRLRQDAQAADEWMAMAVQKMNEMGQVNESLTQQVEALQRQSQLDASNGGNSSSSETSLQQSKLDAEAEVLQKLAAMEDAVQEERKRLEVANTQSQLLSEQLQAERLRVQSLM